MDKHEKIRKIAKNLNVIDDALFQKMAEDIGFCEEMISTILRQKITIKKIVPQNSIKNLQGRSVILDALCTLEKGGEGNMCEAIENFGKECAKEAVMESAYNLFKNGVSYEMVRASINLLSDDELKELYAKATQE